MGQLALNPDSSFTSHVILSMLPNSYFSHCINSSQTQNFCPNDIYFLVAELIQLSSSLLWFLSVKDLLLQDWFPAGLLLAKFYGSQLYLMLKVINPGKRQRWLRPRDMPCWTAATTRLGPPWLCHGCGWCLHSLDEWSSRLQLACHIAWSPPQDWVDPSLCPSHECGGENRAGKVWTSEKEQRSNTYP